MLALDACTHPLFVVNAFLKKEPLSFSLSVSLSLSDTAMPTLLIVCFLVCMKVSVCQTRASFVNIDVHDFYSNLVPFLLALCLSVVLLSWICLSFLFLGFLTPLSIVIGVITHCSDSHLFLCLLSDEDHKYYCYSSVQHNTDISTM